MRNQYLSSYKLNLEINIVYFKNISIFYKYINSRFLSSTSIFPLILQNNDYNRYISIYAVSDLDKATILNKQFTVFIQDNLIIPNLNSQV